MPISFLTKDKETFEDNQKKTAILIEPNGIRNSPNGKNFMSFIHAFNKSNACDFLDFVNLDCSFCMKFLLLKILRKKHSK